VNVQDVWRMSVGNAVFWRSQDGINLQAQLSLCVSGVTNGFCFYSLVHRCTVHVEWHFQSSQRFNLMLVFW
jgi:hypothetical protein